MFRRHLFLFCFYLSMVFALLGADIVWDGSESHNWSDGNNWVGGVAPASGDSPVLTDQGVSPSNMDITGLSIVNLYFGEFTNNGASPEPIATNPPSDFTLSGHGLTITGSTESPQGYPIHLSYTIACNLILNAPVVYQRHRDPVTITYSGVISETGGSRAFDSGSTDGGTILTGKNTFTGYYANHSHSTTLYEDANLGTPPTSFMASHYRGNNSNKCYLYIKAPSGEFFNDIQLHANRGLKFVDRLTIDDDVRVTANGNMEELNAFFNGELILNAPSDSSSTFNLNSGVYLKIRHPQAIGTGTLSVGMSMVDLNGYTYNNYISQYPYVGAIVNFNTTSPAILNGDLGLSYYGGFLAGPGDITINGDILNLGVNRSFIWGGTGTLTIAGNMANMKKSFHRGNVILDHRIENSPKIESTNNLTMFGSNITLLGNDGMSSSENILCNASVFNMGLNRICILSGMNQDATLTMNSITYSNYSACDFYAKNNGVGSAKIVTDGSTSNNNNGTMSISFTYSGNTWAMLNGSSEIVGFPESSYLSTMTADQHITLPAGNTNQASDLDISSLRFDTPGAILNLSGSSTDISFGPNSNVGGGMLVTGNVGASDLIIGGDGFLQPKSFNSGLFVHQNNTSGNLTISCRILDHINNALIKTGPGELVLTNDSSTYDSLLVYGGTLTFSSIADQNINSSLGSGTGGSGGIPLGGGATLRYIGSGHSSNRSIELLSDATIDASGSGELVLTNAIGISNDTVSYNTPTHDYSVLTLTGTGIGQINGIINPSHGSVNKTGSGTWILGGNNIYAESTNVLEGTLKVTSHLEGECYVQSGATLEGSGNIRRGLQLGGNWNVDLRGDNDYDHFTAGGCVVLGGNLNINLINGHQARSCYTLISGSSNISGTFDQITPGYDIIYNEKSVVLLPNNFFPPATLFRFK